MSLDQIIRSFREENNLSMQEFANRSGLSKGYISMLEKGQHPQSQRALVPSLETYRKLASAMCISLDSLLSIVDGDAEIAVNVPPSPSLVLSPEETRLVEDYRDASEEIRGAAATMLHTSAEANRKDARSAG